MRSIVIAVCIMVTSAAVAQETRYRLERIVVEGSHIAEEIVRGEARLVEEQSYTEADFQQALYRIRRLPFVTDATYRIEPGLTAGGTTLVMRILDTTAIFYGVELGAVRGEDGETQRDGSVLLGGRWLLDNLGVLEGAVQDSDEGDGMIAGLAYRAYDIYGTGAAASLSVAQRFRAKERTYDPVVAFSATWPLTQRQSLVVFAGRNKSRIQRDFDVNGDDDAGDEDDPNDEDNVTLTNRDRVDLVELRWLYESTDDPIFTTRGVLASIGPRWTHAENVVEVYDEVTKAPLGTDSKTDGYGLVLDLDGYRPLFGRSVAFLRLSGQGARVEQSEVDLLLGTARLGFAHDFHSNAPGVLRGFKARIELGGGYRTSRLSPPTGPSLSENDTFGEAAFVMRHRWGTVRLTGIYQMD